MSNKINSLSELVTRMIQLYVSNREAIDKQDANNESYREYSKCMRILDEYECRVDSGLRPGFSARIEEISR